MFIDFDKYIKFLSDKKVTPNQFTICWMIHNRDQKNMKLYTKEVGKFNNKDVEYLIEKGYLTSTNPRSIDFISLVTTKLFSDEILIDEEEAFDELLDIYPDYFHMGRNRIDAKACSNLIELERWYYHRIIKGDRIRHKEIIEKSKVVIKMMENGDINWHKIDKFIQGRMWRLADKEDMGSTDLSSFL